MQGATSAPPPGPNQPNPQIPHYWRTDFPPITRPMESHSFPGTIFNPDLNVICTSFPSSGSQKIQIKYFLNVKCCLIVDRDEFICGEKRLIFPLLFPKEMFLHLRTPHCSNSRRTGEWLGCPRICKSLSNAMQVPVAEDPSAHKGGGSVEGAVGEGMVWGVLGYLKGCPPFRT